MLSFSQSQTCIVSLAQPISKLGQILSQLDASEMTFAARVTRSYFSSLNLAKKITSILEHVQFGKIHLRNCLCDTHV